MAPSTASKELSSLESTIIGGITGSIAEAVVMPALVIKTRMMAQGADASLTSYRSAAHAASIAESDAYAGRANSARGHGQQRVVRRIPERRDEHCQ